MKIDKHLTRTDRPQGGHITNNRPHPLNERVVVQVCNMTGWDDETDIQAKIRQEHNQRNREEAAYKALRETFGDT